MPVHRPVPAQAELPGLGYPADSFLGRVVAQSAEPMPAAHINENAMAEALKFMRWRAWPRLAARSLVTRELAEGSLVAAGTGPRWRSVSTGTPPAATRPSTAVWQGAHALASEGG